MERAALICADRYSLFSVSGGSSNGCVKALTRVQRKCLDHSNISQRSRPKSQDLRFLIAGLVVNTVRATRVYPDVALVSLPHEQHSYTYRTALPDLVRGAGLE